MEETEIKYLVYPTPGNVHFTQVEVPKGNRIVHKSTTEEYDTLEECIDRLKELNFDFSNSNSLIREKKKVKGVKKKSTTKSTSKPKKSKGRRRARDEKGHFLADDPSTPDINEAWIEE